MEIILIHPLPQGAKKPYRTKASEAVRTRQAEESSVFGRLEQVFARVIPGNLKVCVIETAEALTAAIEDNALRNQRILLAASIGASGPTPELFSILYLLREVRTQNAIHWDRARQESGKHLYSGETETTDRPQEWGNGCMKGSVGAVWLDGESEDYTKAAGRELIQAMNQSGCSFPGNPFCEATGSLKNFLVRAQNTGCTLERAYELAVGDLLERLLSYPQPMARSHSLLCIHTCDPATSNTYWVWKQLRAEFSGNLMIQEISLRGGPLMDCAGCSYEACMYYSSNADCYYGGTMVEEVYPALMDARALILLCPNYNDALGANLSAFINRLTALYRRRPFSDKSLFAVVISGYSGSDLVTAQLIDALNMNKAFQLPADFAFTETANLAGSIRRVPGIEEKIRSYAAYIEETLLQTAGE